MTWVIGDIHGCLDELNELLDLIPKGEGLVFVGDYIDRGPDSRGVVERLFREAGRSHFLIGNHEDLLLRILRDRHAEDREKWLSERVGGSATIHSYGSLESDWPSEHLKFFSDLKLFYEEDDLLVVHAGVRPGGPPDPREQTRQDLIWIRKDWFSHERDWQGPSIVFGHTPVNFIHGGPLCDVFLGKKSTGIDTGCVQGGCLTAFNPRTREILQVGARQIYWSDPPRS